MNDSQIKATAEPVNRFSHCVNMELRFNASGSELTSDSELNKILLLYPVLSVECSLRFAGEQSMEIPGLSLLVPGGLVTFGLKRGQLKLVMENCFMQIKSDGLGRNLHESNLPEQEAHDRSAIQVEAGLDGVKPIFRMVAKKENEISKKAGLIIICSGSKTDPMWTFRCTCMGDILEGKLDDSLGELPIGPNDACSVEASFCARAEDVRMTSGRIKTIIGGVDICRNKSAVIERLIAYWYLGNLVESAPMCSCRWRHG